MDAPPQDDRSILNFLSNAVDLEEMKEKALGVSLYDVLAVDA